MAFNILIVDDSSTVRSVVAKTLRLARVPIHELREAENGQEALNVLRDHWIDLVFADLNMPVMNGVEMIDEMARDGLLETVPVIILSNEGSLPRIEQLKSKGVSAYIRKPFTPELIRGVVAEVIGESDRGMPNVLLGKVFCEVLEEFAHSFGRETDKDLLPRTVKTCLEATMSFRGPLQGSFEMMAESSTCDDLVRRIVGEEDERISSAKLLDGGDALREMTSITCGHVLTRLGGEAASFDLTSPSLRDVCSEDWESRLEDPETVGFVLEEGPILLRLSVAEDSVCV